MVADVEVGCGCWKLTAKMGEIVYSLSVFWVLVEDVSCHGNRVTAVAGGVGEAYLDLVLE